MKLKTNTIIQGNALKILKQIPDNSIDTVITDPPYGLSNLSEKKVRKALLKWLSGEEDYIPSGKGFMGKDWDAFVPPPALWREVFRVMKYGATALVFAGTRTQDIMTMSMRLAGFKIRDTLMWLYGSGMPKSQDISKMIDKEFGVEREIIGRNPNSRENSGKENTLYKSGTVGKTDYITAPATPEAKIWEGYKTHGLKPAYEPIIMAVKPNDGTYVDNALKCGVAGLNIDETRIEYLSEYDKSQAIPQGKITTKIGNFAGKTQKPEVERNTINKDSYELKGRFPANILLDEESAKMLDEQAPQIGAFAKVRKGHSGKSGGIYHDYKERGDDGKTFYNNGLGGASRFFYVAKASKKERNEGLPKEMRNNHPTIKPLALIEYLVKLTKMPNEDQIYLDPFIGTGITAKAVLKQHRNFIGIELSEEYIKIAKKKIEPYMQKMTLDQYAEEKP